MVEGLRKVGAALKLRGYALRVLRFGVESVRQFSGFFLAGDGSQPGRWGMYSSALQ